MARIAVFILVFLGTGQLVWSQGQPITFSAAGDIPYNDSEAILFQQYVADHNRYSPSAFFAHVGDILNGSCTQDKYDRVANILKGLAIPAYLVVGDHESTDCSNPVNALGMWRGIFVNFEQNFCEAPYTLRQSIRPENFAFVRNGVLFIGINLVGGSVHDQNEWNTRMQDDADWVSQQFQTEVSQVRAAVVFGHAGTDPVRDLFFTQFRQTVKTFAKPVLYIHGNNHTWRYDNPWLESNMSRIVVENGVDEPPVEVTVTTNSQSMFTYKRKPWVGAQPYNMPPCVNAGSDQTITLPAAASLQGQATDDGDPNGALTTTWSMVSGPGTVAFGNANALATIASFSTLGTYVLRLTADDGQLQKSDELTVVAHSAGPALSINDVNIHESNTGAVEAVFTVSLASPDGQTVTVDYQTANGTATAGSDYAATSGTLSFPNGTTTKTIAVTVQSDHNQESNETFFVNLNNATNATLADAQGMGSIINDDFLPTINTFTPANGMVGTVVTITGSHFTGATAVNFNGAAAGFTVDSDTQIKATVPAGATLGTGKIVVTNSVGSTTSAGDFTITSTQATFTITPTHDAYVKSSSQTNNYGDASTLRERLSSSEINYTYLKFEITGLSGALMSAKLRLHVSDASPEGGAVYSVSNSYLGTTTPWIESALNWNNAPSITGTMLSSVGAASVGQWVEFDVTPAIAGNGAYSFGLKNNVDDAVYYRSKEYGSATAPQLVIQSLPSNAPSLNSFAPSDGPVGAEVMITGSKFTGATAVAFNGTLAVFTVEANTQIRATVPAGATTGKITVTNQAGTTHSAADFIVISPPIIASFTPTIAPGGSQVTISGNSFTGATNVAFNGISAASLVVESDVQIRAIIPVGAAPGTGKIVITNSAGSATSANDFTITAAPITFTFAPKHDAYVKSSSATSNYGTAGTVRGKLGSSEIDHGYLKFEVTGLSGTLQNAKLRLNVSDASTDGGTIYLVSNNYKSSTTPWIESGLIWNNAPSVSGTALSSAGAVSIGQWVEFEVTSAIVGNGTYSFGLKNNVSDIVYYRSKEGGSSTIPQLIIQSLASGAPSIASFTPVTGPVGTEVTIAGNNFNGTTKVTFNGMPAIYAIESNTQIRATVPDGATTGKIRITNAAGNASFAAAFLVTVAPAIASFTPASGAAGTEVKIAGSGFNGTTSVSFNGKAATTFFIDSGTQLRAIVPTDAPSGTGKIVVANSAGNAMSAADFTVNILLSFASQHDAYITSYSPTSNAGTAGTLRGKLSSSEIYHSYLKFEVTGLSGVLVSAKLHLYVSDASPDGGSVYLASNNYNSSTTPWIESGLNWNNAPGMNGTVLSSVGAVTIGQWVEFDVTSAITGNGTYSFGLKTNNSDKVYYRAKENGASTSPQLLICVAAPPGGTSKLTNPTALDDAEATAAVPEEFVLHQNYPNPFNPSTTIRFGLPQASHVTIKIYSIDGREVKALVDGEYPAGTHAVALYTENLSSGTYFYMMQAGEVRKIRRLMLVK